MGIEGVSRRSTEDLMNTLANDAGVLKDDEHVRSGAMKQTGGAAWTGRREDQGHDAIHHGVEDGLVHAGEHVLPHVLEHAGYSAAAGIAGGALVAAAPVLQLHMLMTQAWLKPHLKGDEVRAKQTNDAMNVAVARTLDAPPAFGDSIALERPKVETGATMLITALRDKDKDMVPVLQARSDEGFLAAEKAFGDATAGKSPDPGGAVSAQLTAKYKDRMDHDVAFGLGVKLFVWARAQDADTSANVKSSVHARNVPNPTPIAG